MFSVLIAIRAGRNYRDIELTGNVFIEGIFIIFLQASMMGVAPILTMLTVAFLND